MPIAMSDDNFSDGSDEAYSTTPVKAITVKKITKPTAAGPKKPRAKKAKKVSSSDDGDDDDSNDFITNTAPKKSVEETYQKKTQLEHILLRPDTYIGSVEEHSQAMWVYDCEEKKMIEKEISFVPGLFKIFDEILVNAADNKVRDRRMDTLKVDINPSTGTISVLNNGKGIPIEMHSKEGVWVPELIFGHLLTSSNYNDSEKKITGGRNGYGAKLCNIFSKEFIIETMDSSKNKKYFQRFHQNMSQRSDPLIEVIPKSASKSDYTKITFTPDLEKFNLSSLSNDTVLLLKRRVWDLAGTIDGIKVYLNDELLSLKGFKDYAELFLPKEVIVDQDMCGGGGSGDNDSSMSSFINESSDLPSIAAPQILEYKSDKRWVICVARSDGQFHQVSFVNSICTYKGGSHVSYILDQIIKEILDHIKKKHKELSYLKAHLVKPHISLFLNCQIENPTFDSQTKENLTTKAGKFGSTCELPPSFIKKIINDSGIVDKVVSSLKVKQNSQLKKTDGAKTSRISGITKLDDANNAGTKNASKCTLILTEGDSAKALAVSGLGVVGRDNYGVFPLRGKLLNVREASHDQVLKNTEITFIKQILGLKHDKQYTSVDGLRYGSLMIMTDQDHDGSHIKGLIINFLDHFFPSLLRIPGFLLEFITPIVKVTRGKDELSFYTLPEYETWRQNNEDGKGWKVKYYKGLGTSTAKDAKKYFSNMNLHRKTFSPSLPEDRRLIDMAFNKKKSDERKTWLESCDSSTFMDHSTPEIKISDFINKELILFSMADNVRSIPSCVDGLKPGQRKILFSCFKRKLRGEIKVAQLAGYVSEHAAYHHGEVSLCSTMVGMAQNFVGSNNINILEPIGQFGTRNKGGKDSASARYIFTSLAPLTRLIYPVEDDAILSYLTDDGQQIEPEHYCPILPMVLVNGGDGIGTGWMTSLPLHNPEDIVENLLAMMDHRELKIMHPWYNGFRGQISLMDSPSSSSEEGDLKYKVSGSFDWISDCCLEVNELPIGTWTESYKAFLEECLIKNGISKKGESLIKSFTEHHNDIAVRFVITLTEETASSLREDPSLLEKTFKLTSTINCNNLVAFTSVGKIRKYQNTLEILREFFYLRLEYYAKRKNYLTNHLGEEHARLDNKVRFLKEIIANRLKVQNRPKKDICLELKEKGFLAIPPPKKGPSSVTEGDGDGEGEGDSDSVLVADASTPTNDYDYLLGMQISSLTKEKLEKLEKEKETKKEELDSLLKKSPTDLWRIDLDLFMIAFRKEMVACNDLLDKAIKRASSGGSGASGASKTATKKLSKKRKAEGDEGDESDEGDVYEVATSKKKPTSSTSSTSSTTKTTTTASIKKQQKEPIKEDLSLRKDLSKEEIEKLPLMQRMDYFLSMKTAQPPAAPSAAAAAAAQPSKQTKITDSFPKQKKSKIVISSSSDDAEDDEDIVLPSDDDDDDDIY